MRGEDFFEMLEGIDEDILEDAWKSGKRENKRSKKNVFFQGALFKAAAVLLVLGIGAVAAVQAVRSVPSGEGVDITLIDSEKVSAVTEGTFDENNSAVTRIDENTFLINRFCVALTDPVVKSSGDSFATVKVTGLEENTRLNLSVYCLNHEQTRITLVSDIISVDDPGQDEYTIEYKAEYSDIISEGSEMYLFIQYGRGDVFNGMPDDEISPVTVKFEP